MKTGSLELGGFELEGFVTDDLGLDSFGEEGALGLPVGVACRGGTRAVLAGMKVLALGSNFGAIMIRRKSVIGWSIGYYRCIVQALRIFVKMQYW
jgi:hypothetical protein